MTDIPVKSHTAPVRPRDDDDQRNHVAFAPLDTDLDGSGRFMDDSRPEAKPTLTIPKPQFTQRLTASPASGSVRLPESPTSILATTPRTHTSAPGSPSLKPSDDAARAISTLAPAKEDKTLAERVADRTVAEELTAEARHQTETDDADVARELPPPRENGLRSETATLDGVPIGSAALGAVESEVPEGKGTKRLYKMSKMFSESIALSRN